ncbi:MAG: hypothetical protein ACK5GO_07140 [Ignavibacteria bacterium]|jgi:hypothetical protein
MKVFKLITVLIISFLFYSNSLQSQDIDDNTQHPKLTILGNDCISYAQELSNEGLLQKNGEYHYELNCFSIRSFEIQCSGSITISIECANNKRIFYRGNVYIPPVKKKKKYVEGKLEIPYQEIDREACLTEDNSMQTFYVTIIYGPIEEGKVVKCKVFCKEDCYL